MGRSIAVMNTKGGVGKSTIVMAIAETLSAHHGRNVLVIDSDSQTSMSIMLMEMGRWEQMERQKLTLVDFLSRAIINNDPVDWKTHVATNVSDVEEARSIYLMPSHMQLSLFERMISGEHKHAELRTVVRNFLEDAKRYFDVILIDCPPGLSVLTETWLREADYFLPPVKPDYLSVRGLDILKRFRNESDAHGFAELLGTLVNLKDGRIQAENHWHQHLANETENRCFENVVPRRAYLQRAADYDPHMRTYIAKYPGDAGQSIVNVVNEMLERIQAAELRRQSAEAAAAASAVETAVSARAVVEEPVEPQPEQAPEPAEQPAEPEVVIDLEAPVDLTMPILDNETVIPVPPPSVEPAPPRAVEQAPPPPPQRNAYVASQQPAPDPGHVAHPPHRANDAIVRAPDPTLIAGNPPPPRPGRHYSK